MQIFGKHREILGLWRIMSNLTWEHTVSRRHVVLLILGCIKHLLCVVRRAMSLSDFLSQSLIITLPTILKAVILSLRPLIVNVKILSWPGSQSDLLQIASIIFCEAAVFPLAKFCQIFINLILLWVWLLKSLIYLYKCYKSPIYTYLHQKSYVTLLSHLNTLEIGALSAIVLYYTKQRLLVGESLVSLRNLPLTLPVFLFCSTLHYCF